MGIKVREKERGSGVFWLFINHEGRRRSLKAGNLEVANEVADRLRIKLADNPESVFKEKEGPKPVFRTLAKEWMQKVEKRAKPSTAERYAQLLRDWVLPAVGSKRVDQIKKSDIADVLEQAHDENLSISSLGTIRTCFSGPLEIAAFREMIPANPAYGILKQMGFSNTKERMSRVNEVKFLTPEESNNCLAVCREEWPEHHPFFQFLFMTGARLGEALAVTWDDISWKDKTVYIDKAFRRNLDTTKTGAEREVDLPDALIDTLKAFELENKKEALRTGIKMPEIIFHHEGRHMPQQRVRRIYQKILVKAGIHNHRLHDIRHSYASLLLKNGASLDYVKRMLGHSDIAMTSNIYGHLMPDRDRTQVNLLGETILSNPHPTRTQKKQRP